MRRKLVVGNWKMFGRLAANQALLQGVIAGVRDLRGSDCAVCVPYPYLAQAQSLLQGSNIAWGAQNMSHHDEGAYTGEVAAGMLVEFRSTGTQTVFPPSTHESGEPIAWDGEMQEPASIDPQELLEESEESFVDGNHPGDAADG